MQNSNPPRTAVFDTHSQAAVKADKYLVVVPGSAEEIDRAKAVISLRETDADLGLLAH